VEPSGSSGASDVAAERFLWRASEVAPERFLWRASEVAAERKTRNKPVATPACRTHCSAFSPPSGSHPVLAARGGC
jgi:hypothetical protein